MKKLTMILTLLMMTVLTAGAQTSWHKLTNKVNSTQVRMELKLEKYGLYDNGREVNTFYPNTSNGNPKEYMDMIINTEKIHFAISGAEQGMVRAKYMARFPATLCMRKQRRAMVRKLNPTVG